jgi:hypothetical protein
MGKRFTSKYSTEAQVGVLRYVRSLIEAGEDRGVIIAKVWDGWGVTNNMLNKWKQRHAFDYFRKGSRTRSAIRMLVIDAYAPWCTQIVMQHELGFQCLCSVNRIVNKYYVNCKGSPWDTTIPGVHFRDIRQVMELVIEHESLMVVSEKSGYPISELLFIFSLEREEEFRARSDYNTYKAGLHSLRGRSKR